MWKINELEEFTPKQWMKKICKVPSHYKQLAQRGTPIRQWPVPMVPEQFQLSIKRDDMTGSILTGNKVRKLEFLIGDAITRGCDTLVTCGDLQSNHCRTTAVAAKECGLDVYLFILQEPDKSKDLNCHGNFLLDILAGSQVILVPKNTALPSYETVLKPKMEQFMDSLRDNGRTPYLIPRGGTNAVGLFGYLAAFDEMIEQGLLENFDDIVVPIGSGGTAGALALANYLTGSKLRVHAISVRLDADLLYDKVTREFKDVGVDVNARDILHIVDGYRGRGYGLSTQEELDDLVRISNSTGILLDPCYTLKAARGMLQEMKNNPHNFKGHRVLFVHTGGLFGTFDGKVGQHAHKQLVHSSVKWWSEFCIDST